MGLLTWRLAGLELMKGATDRLDIALSAETKVGKVITSTSDVNSWPSRPAKSSPTNSYQQDIGLHDIGCVRPSPSPRPFFFCAVGG